MGAVVKRRDTHTQRFLDFVQELNRIALTWMDGDNERAEGLVNAALRGRLEGAILGTDQPAPLVGATQSETPGREPQGL